jgi:hypothetical protein
VIPLQERIEVADDADLEEVYDTERHLLYVACTCVRPSAGCNRSNHAVIVSRARDLI